MAPRHRAVEDPQADAAAIELLHESDQVVRGAPEAVELPHHERVAGPHMIERQGELGAVGERAAVAAQATFPYATQLDPAVSPSWSLGRLEAAVPRGRADRRARGEKLGSVGSRPARLLLPRPWSETASARRSGIC